jgi:hypothetical protein
MCLQVQISQEVLLGQSRQDAAAIAIQYLMMQELEVIEASIGHRGRGATLRLLLALPCPDAV